MAFCNSCGKKIPDGRVKCMDCIVNDSPTASQTRNNNPILNWNSQPPATKKMLLVLIIIFIVILASGVVYLNPQNHTIIGKWKMVSTSTIFGTTSANADNMQIWEFKADGTYIWDNHGSISTGTWRVLKGGNYVIADFGSKLRLDDNSFLTYFCDINWKGNELYLDLMGLGTDTNSRVY